MSWTVDGLTYDNRIPLTIKTDHLDAAQTDFTCLVRVVDNYQMRIANADGYDVRFTESDGSTLLKFQRRTWSGGGGSTNVDAIFWVKSDLSIVPATTIYLYYRSADTSDGSDVVGDAWDSHYKGAWPMNDDPDTSTVQDVTSNGYDGTKVGAGNPAETDGQVGKCQDFNGTSSKISIGNNAYNSQSAGTFSCWFKPDTVNTSYRVFGLTVDTTHQFNLDVLNDGKPYVQDFADVDRNDAYKTTNALTVGEWSHIAWAANGSTWKIYINGNSETLVALANNNTGKWFSNQSGTCVYNFGYQSSSTPYWLGGLLDECRESDIVRPPAWIKFEYWNQYSADAEWDWGAEETSGATTLTADGSQITCTSADPILTQHHILQSAPSLALDTSSDAALTQHQVQATDSAQEVDTSDIATLTQHQMLGPDASQCADTSSEPVLAVAGVITPDGSQTADTSANAALTQHYVLVVNDSTCVSVCDAPTLIQHHALSPSGCQITSTSDEVTLGNIIYPALPAQGSQIAIFSDLATLTQHHILAPNGAVCVDISDTVFFPVTGETYDDDFLLGVLI